jgi:hypothetical protein
MTSAFTCSRLTKQGQGPDVSTSSIFSRTELLFAHLGQAEDVVTVDMSVERLRVQRRRASAVRCNTLLDSSLLEDPVIGFAFEGLVAKVEKEMTTRWASVSDDVPVIRTPLQLEIA